MATLRLARLTGTGSAIGGGRLRAARLTGTGATSATRKLRAAKLTGTGTGQVRVHSIDDNPAVEPGTLVTQQAVLASSATGPVTWAWTQLSGPTVTLIPAGAKVLFLAPSVMPGDTNTIVLGVTATVAGTTSPQVTATSTALPQTRWAWDGTHWVGASLAQTAPPDDPTTETLPANLPAGYTLLKTIPFDTPANWNLRSQVAAAFTYDPATVNFSQGTSGKDLLIRSHRDTSAGVVHGGEIRDDGHHYRVPLHHFARLIFTYDTPIPGCWPAPGWLRRFSPSSEGEIDYHELFYNVAAGTLHATPYDSTHRSYGSAPFPGAFTGGGAEHTVEFLMDATGATWWYDGVYVDKITPAEFDTNTDAAKGLIGSQTWATQLSDPTGLWFPIISAQWNAGYGGGPPAGPWTWDLRVKPIEIYTIP